MYKLAWFVPEEALDATREFRVETVVRAERAQDGVRALLDAHLYEEGAFELYPLVELEP
jgi:hypothetical protein